MRTTWIQNAKDLDIGRIAKGVIFVMDDVSAPTYMSAVTFRNILLESSAPAVELFIIDYEDMDDQILLWNKLKFRLGLNGEVFLIESGKVKSFVNTLKIEGQNLLRDFLNS